ncbi:MAG: radical SAM protein [Nitrospinota bacterium]|nr:radical SAM protein [Nitrospinota bacterium]
MKIVVANSVGVDPNGYHMVHVPSRWSLGVKNFTNCGYYPWQLAYTSSLLKRETPHQVKFLDGILNGWDHDTYFTLLREERPDCLIMESSTRTIAEDLRLAESAKKSFGARLIFTGQHPMAHPEEVLKIADFVCIGEYEYAVLDLVQGKDPKKIPGVYPNERAELIDVNSLPYPEDDDIRRIDYHEPNCRYRQIQMYGSRGCPRRCNFCAAATLYYDELNWRPRDVSDIVREIRKLTEKYPEMEGVFFDEEVHNIRKNFNIALAREIRKEDLDHLKYEAMCEYASLDEEAMEEMYKAGYYKIRFGVETGSDRVAEKMTLGKKHDLEKLKRMLKFGKKIGLFFYGTFSIGGLGSSVEEDQKTVDLIYELSSQGLMQEVQVSINTPQPGTDFYRTCVEDSLLNPEVDLENFDGNGHVVVDYPHYKADQIKSMFQKALSAFDKGKAEVNRQSFQETAQQSFSSIPPNSKILLLRCVREWMTLGILQAANKNLGLKVDVLGQDAVSSETYQKAGASRIYSYGQGFFSADTIPKDLARQLENIAYDYALLPVANNHLDGYKNVLRVAHMIQPKKILTVFPEGTTRTIK